MKIRLLNTMILAMAVSLLSGSLACHASTIGTAKSNTASVLKTTVLTKQDLDQIHMDIKTAEGYARGIWLEAGNTRKERKQSDKRKYIISCAQDLKRKLKQIQTKTEGLVAPAAASEYQRTVLTLLPIRAVELAGGADEVIVHMHQRKIDWAEVSRDGRGYLEHDLIEMDDYREQLSSRIK